MISLLYAIMILVALACVASVYAPPGQSIGSQKLHILQVYHIMPLVDAFEIFSRYHMYSLTGSQFTQILKVALLSIILNLEALYFTWLCTQSGATYSQEIVYLVYIVLK